MTATGALLSVFAKIFLATMLDAASAIRHGTIARDAGITYLSQDTSQKWQPPFQLRQEHNTSMGY